MDSFVLTIVDTTGIQDYVFNANQLRQISGASYLVYCATHDWVEDALEGMKHNTINFDDVESPYGNEHIEVDDLEAELIYSGGGNVVLLFQTMEHACRFTQNLTGRLIKDAPGLHVVVAHKEIKWKSEALGGENGIFEETLQMLAAHKDNARQPYPLQGMAVTARCVFTGLPATGFDADSRLVSRVAQSRLNANEAARQRLANFIDFLNYVEPPDQLDRLGGDAGERSMIAVVHVDGYKMGDRMREHSSGFKDASQFRDFLDAVRGFSISIQTAAKDALKALTEHVLLHKWNYRPILFGGDDLTFVCDARIGVGLAVYYLKQVERCTLADDRPLICRAGVAIAHTHHPIARLYDLAEELCRSARSIMVEVEKDTLESGGIRCSAIDWHISTGGLEGSLDEIRERSYQVDGIPLHARPWIVRADGALPVVFTKKDWYWRTWQNFAHALTCFKEQEPWKSSHNKVKDLLITLRNGQSAVKHFIVLNDVRLPDMGLSEDTQQGGWQSKRCIYFDAVEAVDLINVAAGEERA